MGKVSYSMNVSLDGYIEDRDGELGWGRMDAELHQWFNDRMRGIAASLYGRRLYETMAAYWPTAESDPDGNEVTRDFARVWNRTPKVVFSRTLREVIPGCRLVQGDVADILPEIRRDLPGDLEVGGADLAGQLLRAGLVDEVELVVHPVAVGGGKPFWPDLERPLDFELAEITRFGSGVVALRYERTPR
ncbi:MAG: dihydrofolate reductase family protein [Chloroflexota bacterium]